MTREENVVPFVRPQTAQQAVLADLRRAIREGELAPGEQIVQESLAERYGLSRVPVRDALKILEGEGHVTYRAHHGYVVTKLDIGELVETYRIRGLLESDAVAVALPNLQNVDVVRMEDAAADIDAAAKVENLIGMCEANHGFHFILFEASGMARMVKIIQQLWDATEPYRSIYYSDAAHRERVRKEHAAIIVAVRHGDNEATLRLLEEHRQHAVQGLRAVLKAGELPVVGPPLARSKPG